MRVGARRTPDALRGTIDTDSRAFDAVGTRWFFLCAFDLGGSTGIAAVSQFRAPGDISHAGF